jgi:thiosulfate dehydrogenase
MAMQPARRFIAATAALLGLCCAPAAAEERPRPDPRTWIVPDVGALPYDAHGLEVRRGRDLVTSTYAYIGPLVADSAKRFAGNNLACANCHLEAGTKKFGLTLVGLYADFPEYSARIGAEITLEDRINSCMTRSMNGRPLTIDAPEMKALVAYVKFLSTGVSPGEKLSGLGTGRMPFLHRAASPDRGERIYRRSCLDCHNTDGSGVPRSPQDLALGYAAPPLWGQDSFNDGAGMARIGDLANFIHFNMPHGADYLNPRISVEDAWDVAAYVESQAQPQKSGLARDFPNLLDKPIDAAYGPYADGFSETQHKYGPFGPIAAEIARLKAEKKPIPNKAK